MKRKIGVVTGTRAEYGLLYWLMKDIEADPDLELQLYVTGMHLSPEFGMTVKEIEADGLPIKERVEILLSSDTPLGMATSTGLGVMRLAQAFDQHKPEIVVVLGDRFEVFAATQAALMLRIPVGHIHGGENTEGAMDEAFRHSMTKMSTWHFTASESYRNRVIQLGEQPERAFNVGAIGLDNFKRLPLMNRAELEKSLGFSLKRPTLLVTHHPTTLQPLAAENGTRALLTALERVSEARIVFTMPNADCGNSIIGKMINSFCEKNSERVAKFTSLGQIRYLSLLKEADACVGNSSSAIIEAPFVGVPTVNLGDRQKSRLKAKSIIDCVEEVSEIESAIRRALSPEFRKEIEGQRLPYDAKDAAGSILTILKNASLDNIAMKPFYNLPVQL